MSSGALPGTVCAWYDTGYAVLLFSKLLCRSLRGLKAGTAGGISYYDDP